MFITLTSHIAYDFSAAIHDAVTQSYIPTVGIDVPQKVFEEMRKSSGWLNDEDAWKTVVASFPTQESVYANQIRAAILDLKNDGCKFVILYAVREEQGYLLPI